jgi:hypothetical protein
MIPLWYPPAWTRHIVVALMWPASIAVVAAYIPGNIKRVLKHPMLVGVKIWAFAHLVRQRRSRRNHPVRRGAGLGGLRSHHAEAPQRCRRSADSDRRRRNDIIAIVVGTILYLALGFCFHPLVIGVPAFGRRRWDIDPCRCTTKSGG